jgi:hypothetical protein
MGGAFGTSATAPRTNSWAQRFRLPASAADVKRTLFGNSPTIDREEAKVDKMIDGICRG